MSDHRIVGSWNLWAQWGPLLIGVGLAIATVGLSELLPPDRATELHAMILVFIAAPYAGFASMDGGRRDFATEVLGITLFCTLAVVGLWVWAPLWIVGYAGHAVWDTLHHPDSGFGAEIVGWYVPFCVSYDLLVAAYLAVTLLG